MSVLLLRAVEELELPVRPPANIKDAIRSASSVHGYHSRALVRDDVRWLKRLARRRAAL